MNDPPFFQFSGSEIQMPYSVGKWKERAWLSSVDAHKLVPERDDEQEAGKSFKLWSHIPISGKILQKPTLKSQL